MFEASADALLLSDDTGRILLANAAALDLFGYRAEEMLGFQVEMLIPARYRAQHRRYRERFVSRAEKRPMGKGGELLALRSDGQEIAVDISLSPIATQGRTYILTTFFDASLARQAQKALQESEERLRLAKQAAGLGVFDRDLATNALHWDQRSREILGFAPDEPATYDKFLAAIHPEDRALREAAILHAFDPSGSGEYHAEFRVIDQRDGSERWVASNGHVIFENGRAVRLVGVMQDITRQHYIERKFQEQRLETENLLKRQVAALTASAIAHELNQPLAAVSAYSEVAMRELDRIDAPEKLRRALAGCTEQAQRAGQALHELIDFLHHGEVATAEMDLNEAVCDTIALAKKDGLGGFHPVLQLDPRLPPVLANRIQVQKVLINLIRNGIEAERDAGLPRSALVIRVRTAMEPGMAQVTVQDSGPGLDPETAHRIFDPFYTTKSRGFGMGLAVSRALVNANGGELWAELHAGAGAIFHFTLPLAYALDQNLHRG